MSYSSIPEATILSVAYPRHHQHSVQPQSCNKAIIHLPQLYVGGMDMELDHPLRVFKRRSVEIRVGLKYMKVMVNGTL